MHRSARKSPVQWWPLGLLSAGFITSAALAGATCYDIVHGPIWPGDQGWVNGGSCVWGCNVAFDRIVPGTQCLAPVSTGGPVTAICFTGTLRQNPDGTWACKGNGGMSVTTESATIKCQIPC